MERDAKLHVTPRLIVGLLIAVGGLLLLLDNFDLLDAAFVGSWWPAIFVVLGLMQLIWGDNPIPKVFGLALILFGSALILANLRPDLLDSGAIWGSLWPLALVFVGGLLIYRTLLSGDGREPRQLQNGDVHIFAMWSGQERRIASRHFRGGEVTAIMGGFALDLREAEIPAGETAVLDTFSLMGGGEIRVPEDWTVVSSVTPFMGGLSDKTKVPEHPNRVLQVKGFAMMGGLEIKN